MTCRPQWEGGSFKGSEEERKTILAEAMALGADGRDHGRDLFSAKTIGFRSPPRAVEVVADVRIGISRAAHLKALEGRADGVIVASALLDAIGSAPEDAAIQVSRFLRELRPQPAR